MRATSAAGSSRVASSMRCSSWPSASRSSPSSEVSKENDAVSAARSGPPPASATKPCRWLTSRLTIDRCSTATPLGRPVEPEV
ncbi:hypothetical protein SANTM175S_10261 [Streptomyces antimycoticus]